MEIDAAIKIGEGIQFDRAEPLLPGEVESIKLGIEALKQTKRHRKANHYYDEALLPGETRET